MSDVETEVYSFVCKYAKKKFPTLHTASASPDKEPDFPFAQIALVASSDVERTLTSSHNNEAKRVRFDVDVYSANPKAPKIEAKRISTVLADAFKALGFVQTAGSEPVDLTDAQNRSIVRFSSRYEAAVHNGVIHTI